jgi:hypothetical protein
LLAFDGLQEAERIEGLLSEYEAVTQAVRTNHAFAAHEELGKDHRRVIGMLEFDPETAPVRPSTEDIRRASQKLLEFVNRRSKAPPS